MEYISPTEVRLKPGVALKAQNIWEMAEGNFDHIWTILQEARYAQLHQAQLIDKKGIKKLVADFNHDIFLRPYLPETSYCGQSYQTSGLMYQYQGWNIETDCLVYALTSAILPARRCVVLNYYISSLGQPPKVQVKRDLVFLKLVDSQMTMQNTSTYYWRTVTQHFCTDEPITNTVALYSIGWASIDQLNKIYNGILPVRLNSISVPEK